MPSFINIINTINVHDRENKLDPSVNSTADKRQMKQREDKKPHTPTHHNQNNLTTYRLTLRHGELVAPLYRYTITLSSSVKSSAT